MLTVHIENETYQLPECKEELSLKKYIELASIKEENKTRANALVISTLLGCDMDFIMNIDINQFKEMCSHIEFLKEIAVDIQETKEFEIEGIKYKVKDDFSKITVGEMSDIELISENKEYSESIPYIISALVREVDSPQKSAIQKAELILEHLSAVEALGVILFFSIGVMQYIENLSSSLNQEPPTTETTSETSEKPLEVSG